MKKKRILGRKFFARKSPLVARDLIGKFLVRKIRSHSRSRLDHSPNEKIAFMITETEAYDGTRDLASHASKGRTSRTETLYAKPGTLYVYLCYGMYYMSNVVTDRRDYPSAVLIRAVESVEKNNAVRLDGPGKLTRELKIGKSFNGAIATPKNDLWFEDRGIRIPPQKIKKTPRIGVDYAGPVWSKKLWRFVYQK